MTAICRIEGCPNEAGLPGTARGLCRAHYHRFHRYGTADVEVRRVKSWAGQRCAAGDCDGVITYRGLCEKHNARIRRKIDPEGERRRHLAHRERLLRKREAILGRKRPSTCEICGSDGCGRGNKPESGICFDHDHATGVPRGWLCDRCNKVLGLVYDNPALMHKLIRYLEAHRETNRSAA